MNTIPAVFVEAEAHCFLYRGMIVRTVVNAHPDGPRVWRASVTLPPKDPDWEATAAAMEARATSCQWYDIQWHPAGGLNCPTRPDAIVAAQASIDRVAEYDGGLDAAITAIRA